MVPACAENREAQIVPADQRHFSVDRTATYRE